MNTESSLRVAQIAATLLTPIIVSGIGILIVGLAEQIKVDTAKRSAFYVRWAEEFFDACQGFQRAIEHETAILYFLVDGNTLSVEARDKMQQDQLETHFLACELSFRIRRCAQFAEHNREHVVRLADNLFHFVNKLVRERQGQSERIFEQLGEFNECARQAHAEILALDRVGKKNAWTR